MKRLILTIASIFTLTIVPLAPVAAIDVFEPCTEETENTTICEATDDDKLFGEGGIWYTILNVFTYIIGAISVIMIIIGGLRYVISSGDSAQITNAKNTILYAVIGLIVALLANAIVNFVLTNI